MCDRARPLGEGGEGFVPAAGQDGAGGDKTPISGKLYLKTPSAEDPRMRKARLVLNMFPGTQQVVIYCEDTKKKLGAVCQLLPSLLKELKELFGEANVVVK